MNTRPRLLEFIHLHSFDQTAEELLDDDDLRLIQQMLIETPHTGAVVQGTGGLRKLRISAPGRGKRGGARLLYLYVEIRPVIYLVIVSTKRKQIDHRGLPRARGTGETSQKGEVMDEQHSELGKLIIAGLQEAIRHARGEDTGARVVTMEVTARKAYLEPPPYYPPHLLREVRHRLSVSQTIFAQMLGVSASSIRAWEQGKREPEGPARRLIQIADLHPEILRETCGEIHPATGGKASLPRRLRAPATARPERLAADTGAS